MGLAPRRASSMRGSSAWIRISDGSRYLPTSAVTWTRCRNRCGAHSERERAQGRAAGREAASGAKESGAGSGEQAR